MYVVYCKLYSVKHFLGLFYFSERLKNSVKGQKKVQIEIEKIQETLTNINSSNRIMEDQQYEAIYMKILA